jgi:hypothetical protein
MVLWGAIWGALLGFYAGRHDSGFGFLVGALLGALAGRMLRSEVRKEARLEVQRELAAQRDALPLAVPAIASPANTPAVAPADAAPDPAPGDASAAAEPDFTDTMPGFAAAQASARPLPTAPAQPVNTTPDLASQAFTYARNWLLGGNTIVRMGVLVLFVGLAFLAKFAMDNALLPPELRLAAIGTAGIALFVFGFRLFSRQPGRLAYALTLQGAGVAVLYLTVFAAFRLYQFLPAGAAFGVLALVCAFSTAIALLQNAMPMAFIGFAGAFAAPILLSTGQGDHVGLFSYYLLLSAAIVSVAWIKAWRALNLLGFFATFGVATAWGVLKYQPEQLASTEPFLLAFFALYLAASLMYATRHGLKPKQAVDATLIFGTPIVTMGLQAALVRDIEYATAFSSLAMGALYLGLGWWALQAQRCGCGPVAGRVFCCAGPGFCNPGRAVGAGRPLDLGRVGRRGRRRVLDGATPGPLAGAIGGAGIAGVCGPELFGLVRVSPNLRVAPGQSGVYRGLPVGGVGTGHCQLGTCRRGGGGLHLGANLCHAGKEAVAAVVLGRFPVVAMGTLA